MACQKHNVLLLKKKIKKWERRGRYPSAPKQYNLPTGQAICKNELPASSSWSTAQIPARFTISSQMYLWLIPDLREDVSTCPLLWEPLPWVYSSIRSLIPGREGGMQGMEERPRGIGDASQLPWRSCADHSWLSWQTGQTPFFSSLNIHEWPNNSKWKDRKI